MIYSIYKTVNTINNKEYVGFHSLKNKSDILSVESESGSIFRDGYLGSGVLIKKALMKYGPENMKQVLLYVTDNKKDAELFEADIVNVEWILDESNYNLSLGGNVCVLFGENNGGFGKKHKKETILQIQNARNETFKSSPFTWAEVIIVETGEICYNREQLYNYFGLCDVGPTKTKLHNLATLFSQGVCRYKSDFLQTRMIDRFNERQQWLDEKAERNAIKSKICSDRFSGVPKTPESNAKRGESISRWVGQGNDT